jgi:hypothetical protein
VRREAGGILLGEVPRPELEVELPELVGARQNFNGALEDVGLLDDAAARLFEAHIIQPRLHAAGVALDVLLVRDVLVGDQVEVARALHFPLRGPREARGDGAEEFAGHCGGCIAVGQPAVGKDAMGCGRDG